MQQIIAAVIKPFDGCSQLTLELEVWADVQSLDAQAAAVAVTKSATV